jgi:tetratricopeptide (TPR) repeat protein
VLEQGSGRVPDSALIAYVYGSLLFETAAGDAKIFERARAALEKSRALNPLFANTYYRLARMQLKSGDPDQAKALFEKAIALNPKNAQAMYQLSLLLARQGDKKRAAELRTAVQQVHAERDSLLQEMASQPAGQSPDAGLKKPGPAAH